MDCARVEHNRRALHFKIRNGAPVIAGQGKFQAVQRVQRLGQGCFVRRGGPLYSNIQRDPVRNRFVQRHSAHFIGGGVCIRIDGELSGIVSVC